MGAQIIATERRARDLREDAESIIKDSKHYLKGGPRQIAMHAEAAEKVAEADAIKAVLTERQHCVTILQNAYNVAEADFNEASDALRVQCDPALIPVLESTKVKHWAVMYALQEARNMITERGQ